MSTSAELLAQPGTPELVGAAFDRLPVPALVVEREAARILAANRSARKLIGGASDRADPTGDGDDDIVGHGLADYTDRAHSDLADDLRVAAGGTYLPIDLVAGPGTTTRLFGRVDHLGKERQDCWLLTLHDQDPSREKFVQLTERVQESHTQEMRRHRQMLKDKNRELEAARRRLETVNGDLEHFVHIAAHDLREPCRRQQLLVDILLEDHRDSLDPEVIAHVERLLDQSEKMLGMIEGFRHLTNVAGPAIELITVDLRSRAEALVAELVPADERCGVTIDLPTSVPAYDALVGLLLQNLIRNAVRHGARPLDLQLRATADRGTAFEVVNRIDQSIPGHLDLLQPFTRGTEASDDNSGLGLSICKRVVERHAGTISVRHTDDQFIVHFTLEAKR